VPPTGVTGAVFVGGRLLLAGERDGTYQVWAVSTKTGARTLEIETRICGESEGLDTISTLGGELHWLIAPFDPGCELTYGPTSALLHYAPARGNARLRVRLLGSSGSVPGRVRARVSVRHGGAPVRGARVQLAGSHARTNRRGRAVVRTRLALPGRFKALARAGHAYGLSQLVPLGTG
jgi:hypothetical protein